MINTFSDEYLNRKSSIDDDTHVLSIGLVECKNLLSSPQNIIDKIEYIDSNILKSKTMIKQWSGRSYKYDNPNNIDLCLSKPIPSINELNPKDQFYDEQYFISNQLNLAIENGLKKYYNIYPRAEKNVRSKEKFPKLLKYSVGNRMPAHSDHGITSRVISCILYLNDDYVGGELYFPYLDIMVKPEAGSVIFFPSNYIYTHEVKPIISGVRYSYPNWFHNIEKQMLPENPNSKTEQWNKLDTK